MKLSSKSIYIFVGAALLLTSCSQGDEPYRIDDDSRRILFHASLPEVNTRAEETTRAKLPHFYVTAFDFEDGSLVKNGVMTPLFDNQKIEITGVSGLFSSPECCWPDATKESHTVSFYGFYPGLPELQGAGLENISTASSTAYSLTGFRVKEDIADQIDFITAYATGNMVDDQFSGVKLPFAHQLSRIEIKAYGKHKTCDIEIAGVRIGGVGVEDRFDFKPIDGGGEWDPDPVRGVVEYIFRKGDKIINCGKNNPIDSIDAVSIMGAKRAGGYENSAMLIPCSYNKWDFANDRRNANKQLYISVLLRITDATVNAGINPKETQRYPYRDLSQGVDAPKIPVEYLAIDKASGEVAKRLYKNDLGYYTVDPLSTEPYTLKENEEVKEFGWASLPVAGEWAPGGIYTYNLNYTYGVGVHDPSVTTTISPRAGDPVISDRIGLTYTVKEWNTGEGDQFTAPCY